MIITLSHQKGGVGKSTLAWNLIVEYSKNRKIYVIDLDIQKTITYSIQIRKNKLGDDKTKNIILLNPQNDKEMVEMMIMLGR
jgi:chromosome partitioning protein